jgi:hypothetical protein
MTLGSLSAATRAQGGDSARNSRFQPQASIQNLIANADAFSIGILPVLRNEGSDQRESKDPSRRPRLFRQNLHLLIANLELEFHLTQRKTSSLRIPNRKFLRVLCARWPSDNFYMDLQTLTRKGRLANPQAEGNLSPTPFLIHGGAIKTPRNPFKNSNFKISNRRLGRGTIC